MSYAYEVRYDLGTEDADEAQRRAELIDAAVSHHFDLGIIPEEVEYVEAEGLYEF